MGGRRRRALPRGRPPRSGPEGFSDSRATWNVIPQQIPATQVDTVPGDGRAFVMDFWDGYMRCTLDDAAFRTDLRVLPYVTRPGAPISARTSFVTENGSPDLRRA
ncbi:hypothetical protein [Actinomadura sediminis]|uniref:Uncharacterized protein n=1 Tax=Actinomadura sediminis TaxID=1038904 RepID=A0ABW3EII3_9ACTN